MTGRKHSKGWISCLSITFDREYVKIIVSKRTDEKMTDPKAQAMAVLQKNHLRVTKQRKTLIDFLVAIRIATSVLPRSISICASFIQRQP